jgi:hypothetical protein
VNIIDAARNAAARLLLLDECSITRAGTPVFSPATGTYATTTTVIFAGPCNLTPFASSSALSEQLGGQAVDTRTYRMTLPWDAPQILEEDTAAVTVSADPLLTARSFRVVHIEGETFQAARRLIVEEIRT